MTVAINNRVPPPSTPLLDSSGMLAPEWYRFFNQFFSLATTTAQTVDNSSLLFLLSGPDTPVEQPKDLLDMFSPMVVNVESSGQLELFTSVLETKTEVQMGDINIFNEVKNEISELFSNVSSAVDEDQIALKSWAFMGS